MPRRENTMEALLILFLGLYLLSPIPLLILTIMQGNRNKKLNEELFELKNLLMKRNNQPGTFTGVPVDSAFEAKVPPVTSVEQAPVTPAVPAPVTPATPAPAAPAAPASVTPTAPVTNVNVTPVSKVPEDAPAPAPVVSPEVPVIKPESSTVPSGNRPAPLPVNPMNPTPRSAPLPINPSQSAPQTPKSNVGLQHIVGFQDPRDKAKQKADGENTTVPVLAIGVVLLLLAAVGFISATWSNLSAGARAVCLLSFSFILLAAGIFARLRLHLDNASLAFYSIGSAALPITICGSAFFGLLGDAFSYKTFSAGCNTFILAFACLLFLLVFGAVFFESRVFAAGALGTVTVLVFTVAMRIRDYYPADLIVMVFFIAAAVLLIPLVERIEAYSNFYPFAEVFEIYAVVNTYVLTCACLAIAGKSPVAGIGLILLGAVFFHPVFLSRSDGMLSLPGIALLLVGTGILFPPNELLSAILWMETAAACLLALSYVLRKKSIVKTAAFGIGLLFLVAVPFPLFVYALIKFTAHPAPLILTLPVIGGFLLLAINRKQPLYSVGAILPVFTLLYGGSLHVLSCFVPEADRVQYEVIFPHMGRDYVVLAGFIVAALLYAVYHLIPHQRFFTAAGSVELMLILSFFGFMYTEEGFFTDGNSFAVKNVFAFGFILLALFMALRTDLFHVRDRSVTKAPYSINCLRCIYAVCWPVYYLLAYLSWGRPGTTASGLSLTAFIVLCFALTVYAVSLTDIIDWKKLSENKRLTPARLLAAGTALLSMLVGLSAFCTAQEYVRRSSSGLYVLRHLLPFLIPALLLYAFLHFKKIAPKASTVMLLCSLYSATACLFYAAEIFRKLGTVEALSVPEFCFTAEFFLSLAVIPILIYYLLRSEKDSFLTRAGFIWAAGTTLLLFVIRLCDGSLSENVIFSVAIGLSLILISCLMKRINEPVGLVFCGVFAVHYLHTIHVLCDLNGVPAWGKVLIAQIPVVLFALTKFHTFMDLFQIIAFIAAPIITWTQNEQARIYVMEKLGQKPDTHNIIGQLARTFVYLFAESHYAVFALPGFFVIAGFYFFTKTDDDTRKRLLALTSIALSTLLCLRFPVCLSAADFFGQLYLVPLVLFFVFLPWILPGKIAYTQSGQQGIETAQIIASVIAMALLGLTAVGDESIQNLLCYAIVSFIVLFLAYVFKNRNYLYLGIACMVALMLYLINRIWGDMSWWIYLFLTGTTLIAIAVRNEIKKRR